MNASEGKDVAWTTLSSLTFVRALGLHPGLNLNVVTLRSKQNDK